jgi:hypothetical protein
MQTYPNKKENYGQMATTTGHQAIGAMSDTKVMNPKVGELRRG